MKINIVFKNRNHVCDTRDFTEEEAINLIKITTKYITKSPNNFENFQYYYIEDYFSIYWFNDNRFNILITLSKDVIVKIINYYIKYSDESKIKRKAYSILENIDELINEAIIKDIIE